MPILLKVLKVTAMIALAIGLVVGGGFLWLAQSLPQSDGEITVAGLDAPVEILRDDDGIVTIRAESERDGAFALGFVHAQDRLWQMDFMRRTGAGRLSETVGAGTIRLDRFMRVLGLHRLAEASFEHLSAPVRTAIEAYAAGVNAHLESRSGPLPPEFLMLGYEPEPWRPADSLVWGRLMALQLSGNWKTELSRMRVERKLSPEQLATLWPDTAEQDFISLAAAPDPRLLREASYLLDLLPWSLAPKDASNAWALSGSRTTSGKPILAHDPHLELSSPGLWYLARIETPQLTLTGATAPGIPFLVLGHNGHIAWGFTTTHSDTQDLFIERVAPDDPAAYLAPEGPLAFVTRDEEIAVKDGESVRFTVRHTRHGPVLSDVAPGEAGLESDQVLALAWPALLPEDLTPEALFALNRARHAGAVVEALRNFHAPQQNVIFADRGGRIGFVAPARVPMRKDGDGTRPVPGWSGDFDWLGFVPYDELPQRLDPPDGQLITANNRVVPPDYPHLLTTHWPPSYRAQRIEQTLQSGGQGLEETAALQLDTVSGAAQVLLPYLARARFENERTAAWARTLEAWDRRMDRNRSEPLVFTTWMGLLNQLLFLDELGEDYGQFSRPDPRRIMAALDRHPAWCDNVTTEPVEDCPETIAAALERALGYIDSRFGAHERDWRWGKAHRVRFPHAFWDRVPFVGGRFGPQVEADGGDFTINRGGALFNGPSENLFEDIHGPGYRAVYDLSDLDASRFMIATGQSGNPLSSHNGDLAERWRDGEQVTMTADGPATDRLRLLPQ